MTLELPAQRPATVREALSKVSAENLSGGFVAFLFAATTPIVLVLAAAAKGGLSEAEIASWLFGGFFINGFITIAFSMAYRQPLIFLFTMPGTVLVGQALAHLSFPEVIGAYVVCGLLVFILGVTGLVGRAMQLIPMPIVMAMVAGVFLQFGIDWIKAFQTALPVAAAMTVVYLALLALPSVAVRMPPMIAALLIGIAVAYWHGGVTPSANISFDLAAPMLIMPIFSWPAIAELSVPVAITVLAVQNGQGISVLHSEGHRPPVNAIATASGLGALAISCLGSVPTCLAGPATAILTSGVDRDRQYVGAVFMAMLGIAFGLCAPILARLAMAAPDGLITALAGLTMLKILQAAFTSAFQGQHSFGALVTFIVTVAGLPILNIGAPFWGLVFGALASRIFDRG